MTGGHVQMGWTRVGRFAVPGYVPVVQQIVAAVSESASDAGGLG